MTLKHILDLAYKRALEDVQEERDFMTAFPDESSFERYRSAKETLKQIVDIMNGDSEVLQNA